MAKARAILREQGPRVLFEHARGWARTRVGLAPISKRREARMIAGAMHLPRHLTGVVDTAHVLSADWTNPRRFSSPRTDGPLTLNWVIPTANKGSGGHQNIFRFVRYMEARGHTCRIYVHDHHRTRSGAMHEQLIREHFEPMRASIAVLPEAMEPADAIVATSWPTAYPVYADPSDAQRFYFVQDFEPYFYPVGSEHVLAENTYRLGFHGITAGRWLEHKLTTEYGMACDHYDFGADADRYALTNRERRNAILFYARPPTPRRAWEFGMLTLDVFARSNPGTTIHLAGWPMRGYKAPFDYVDHGVLGLDELNPLYNELAAALVLSLTNCSLLPLELLAAGCVPVVNDAPNNRMVVDNPFVRYTPMSPLALADELARVVVDPNQTAHAEQAAASVATASWHASCERFEQIVLERLRG